MSYRILVINPGSTSTKIGVYEDEQLLFDKTLRHSAEDIAQFKTIAAQKDWRRDLVMRALREQGIDARTLSAVSGRGGLLRPIRGGTYAVNDNMVTDCTIGIQGQHASNLGGLIAREIGDELGIPSYIVDPVVIDEMADVARYAGHPLFQRVSIFHALNQKAVAKRFAKEQGKKYEELNLIVCHMGGGVSIGAHMKGSVVDTQNALDGEGPFSPERSGSLPTGQLVKQCFSGKYTEAEMQTVTDVELQPCTAGESPVLTLYFAAKDESLWDIAKKFRSRTELIQQENEIIAEHQDLWDLAFNAVDKDTVGSQTGDYADFLKMALENIKDQLSSENFKTLSEDVKKIKALEEQLAALPQEDSNPTGTSLDSAKSFPAFTGKDFDGNAVDESLFTNNSVTLVNFWFNGCSPCVGELPALQKLHDSLQEKGGAVVGINVETLDENEDTIAAAKEIMKKQGASYQNIYFDSDSEAGKLALSVMTFPTSVLIDSEGNIVGDVIVGGLDNEKTMASVQKQIDEILAK